jgi:plasmid stabilization system protein ParE
LEKKLKIKWTEKSLAALQNVYNFYAEKSVEAANRVIDDIVETAEAITFAEQYQQDEVLPQFRRMIVRHYKILYQVDDNVVYIMNVFDTRQNPLKIIK